MRFSINIPNFGDFGASPTNAAEASDLLGPLIEAGATWWDERRPIDDEINRLELVLRRIEAGPSAVD